MPPQDDRQGVERNKRVVKRMLDAWNQRHEAHLVKDLLEDQTVTHFARPVVLRGATEHKPSEAETPLPGDAFPDQQFSEEIVIAEGDLVFVGWKATGTHQKEFMGNAPTRKEVSVFGSDVLRVSENGKIAEHMGYYSKPRLHALAQLGLLDDKTQERLRTQKLLRPAGAAGIIRKPER